MSTNYIVQIRGHSTYTELIALALRQGPFAQFRCAVAYATAGGVRTLEKVLKEGLGTGWQELEKFWLVGIDWCRSDPPALGRMLGFNKSKVRVPAGRDLISSD